VTRADGPGRLAPALRRALGVAGHPAGVAVLGATLVLGVGWLRWRGLPTSDVTAVLAVRLWSAALGAALLSWLASAALGRRTAGALAALGLLVLLAHGWRASLVSYRATLDLGLGEQASAWASVQAGRPGPPPPLTLEGAPSGAGGRFVVALGGRRAELDLDTPGTLGDELVLRITGWEAAPLVIALTEQGEVLDQLLAKLRLAHQPPEYVELGELPHRFYLSSAQPVAAGATPDRLELRIQRCKLTVRRLELLKDHGIRFDGRIFKYQDGASWITLEVARRAGPGLAWAGAVLLAMAAVLRVRRRG
jgi:hypothetical protein